MTIKRVKLGHAVTFKRSHFNISTQNIKFAEFCRACGKWGYEYLQKEITNIPFYIQFIAASCKDFKSL